MKIDSGGVEEYLHKMLSIVKVNKDNDLILDMTMYQVINYYKVVSSTKMHDALLNGIYTGNVDKKHYKNLADDL